MNKQVLSRVIENALGLKINTLHYYIKAGAISPDIEQSSGHGSRRKFSMLNLAEAVIIKRLMDFGLPQREIVRMMRSIRDAGERKMLDCVLRGASNVTPNTNIPGFALKSGVKEYEHEYVVFLPKGAFERGHKFVTGSKNVAEFLEKHSCAIVIELMNVWGNSFVLLKEIS